MKKTREIDVWLSCMPENCRSERYSYRQKPSEPFNIKAKLVIEQPEKKIEITESEFDDKLKDFGYQIRENIKKQLGF